MLPFRLSLGYPNVTSRLPLFPEMHLVKCGEYIFHSVTLTEIVWNGR
jgi:hypothetical protein